MIGNISPFEGWHGIAIEYVDALNLKELVNQGELKEHEFLLVLSKLVKLVQQLHSMGYVHGDLKPENTLVKVEEQKGKGRTLKVYLIDFQFSHKIFRRGKLTGKLIHKREVQE